jgi:hypothetical protein
MELPVAETLLGEHLKECLINICWLQILDIMTLTLFLMALDCQYFSRPADQLFYNQEFPDVCEWQI